MDKYYETKRNWALAHKEVHRMDCQKWDREHKDVKRENFKMYSQKHPEIIKAHNIAHKISLGYCCELCDSIEKLERHHLDYKYPEIIVTLCKECHELQ